MRTHVGAALGREVEAGREIDGDLALRSPAGGEPDPHLPEVELDRAARRARETRRPPRPFRRSTRAARRASTSRTRRVVASRARRSAASVVDGRLTSQRERLARPCPAARPRRSSASVPSVVAAEAGVEREIEARRRKRDRRPRGRAARAPARARARPIDPRSRRWRPAKLDVDRRRAARRPRAATAPRSLRCGTAAASSRASALLEQARDVPGAGLRRGPGGAWRPFDLGGADLEPATQQRQERRAHPQRVGDQEIGRRPPPAGRRSRARRRAAPPRERARRRPRRGGTCAARSPSTPAPRSGPGSALRRPGAAYRTRRGSRARRPPRRRRARMRPARRIATQGIASPQGYRQRRARLRSSAIPFSLGGGTTMSEAAFDETTAHRHFAAACFNRAWDYLDLPQRNEKQVEEMLHAAHASFWHWLHVPEQTPVNMSIGLWQLARVYAVAGRADDARRWARRCLERGRDRAARSVLSRLRPRGDGARRARGRRRRERSQRHSPPRARCCPRSRSSTIASGWRATSTRSSAALEVSP